MQPRAVAALSGSTGVANRSSSSLVTPSVTLLSDPLPKQVDAHLFDFLSAEVIRMMIDSEAFARSRRAEQEKLVEADAAFLSSPMADLSLRDRRLSAISFGERRGSPIGDRCPTVVQDADEAVQLRLDKLGFKVGWALTERLARDRPRFPMAPPPVTPTPASAIPPPPVPDTLEVVKFVCKDLWIALYDKQIDNLRTNHRGVYVLHDTGFKPLARLSGTGDDVQLARMVKFLLANPAGIIRGALANLGIVCTVVAESGILPQSTFQIKTLKA